MYRRIFVISAFCFSLVTFVLFSQETWIRSYDPFPNDYLWSVEDVIECSDGGFAINGTYVDDDTYAIGFVLKTDCDGNFEWADKDTVNFQYDNESMAIVETYDEGIISVTGFAPNGSALIKRDLYGNRIWSVLLPELFQESMTKTNDGMIAAAGFSFYNNFSWPSLTKIDLNSEIIWSQTYEFINYEWGSFKSLIQSSDGGFLLTGYVKHPETERDILVIKTDAYGDSLWSRILDITGLDDSGKTIVETIEGEIIIGGYLGNISGFSWKLDAQGNTIWFETPQEGQSVFLKANDNNILSLSGWGEDLYISKFDNNFNTIWQQEFQFSYGQGDKSFCQNLSDNIFVSIYDYPFVGLVKLNPDGTDINNNELIKPTSIINAYPNPFNPICKFKFALFRDTKVIIKIYNIKGQLISEFNKGSLKMGNHSTLWDANNYPSGVYFAQLLFNNKVAETKKISLIK